MIRFETIRFGTLEVEEDRIISFPEGIPGFSELRRYVLLDYKDTPLKWLQAVDDPEVAFIVAEPVLVSPDYSISIDDAVKNRIQLHNEEDLAVLLILRVEDGNLIANLNGPLLINAGAMKGIQAVADRHLIN